MRALKDLGVWLLMFTMVFAIVYVMMLSADAEYEVGLEKERAYFDRVEELKKHNTGETK